MEIVREAIPERGRQRDAKARPCKEVDDPSTQDAAAAPPDSQPGLPQNGADLSGFGWEELVEEARTGIVAFDGGLLTIVPTPAGTTIDIDGDLPLLELALRSAAAVAQSLLRLDIGGSILVDLPSLEGKDDRKRVAAVVDRMLPLPFERTGVNGFGLLQIVRPRLRASLIERVQNQPVETAALDLLRRAERAGPAPYLELRGGERIAQWLQAHPAFLQQLARRTGARVALKAAGSDPLWWGDVHAASQMPDLPPPGLA